MDEITPDNVVLFDLEKKLCKPTQGCITELVDWLFDYVIKSGKVIKMELIFGWGAVLSFQISL